jgi:hypothetical protein
MGPGISMWGIEMLAAIVVSLFVLGRAKTSCAYRSIDVSKCMDWYIRLLLWGYSFKIYKSREEVSHGLQTLCHWYMYMKRERCLVNTIAT